MMLLHRISLLITITILILPWVASADSELQARDVVKRGTVELGVMAGYLQGEKIFTSISSNREAIYALPRLGLVVSPELGSRWYQGNLAAFIEPIYAHYFTPFGASAAGGSLLFKYNFLAFGRWMPFWDLGLGMLWTNLAPRIPEQSTHFNFVLENRSRHSIFYL